MFLRLSAILLVLLFYKSSFSQINYSGTAFYNVTPIVENMSEQSHDMANSLEPFSAEIVKSFVFRLDFDNSVSQFTMVSSKDLMAYTEKSIKLSAIQYGYADTIWQHDNKAFTKTFEGFGEKSPALLIRALDDPNWKITTEKKQIDRFTCYKATKTAVVKRGKKTFSTPMIAWFCPDIPISIGPLDFGGLPGLVMEAQTNKYLYGLKQIQFRDLTIPFKMPSYPVFTEDELIKRLFEAK